MTVLAVTRITPQNLAAFQISTANATTAFGLQNALMATGSTAAMKVTTGIRVPNLLQVTILQPSLPDQVAWPGDWILVTDATYDNTTQQWTVASTTQAIVYGTGTGQVGTPADFINTFTADTTLAWAASAPTASAQTGSELVLSFPAPTSADGPWTWEHTLTDHTSNTTGSPTAFTPTTGPDGNLTTTLTGLTVGHDYSATVTCTDHYSHTATTLASNTVTAAA